MDEDSAEGGGGVVLYSATRRVVLVVTSNFSVASLRNGVATTRVHNFLVRRDRRRALRRRARKSLHSNLTLVPAGDQLAYSM